MEMKPNGTVGRAIAEYLGADLSEMTALEGFLDPMVPGTFAFQATIRATTYQFLVCVPLQKVTSEDLEEIECEWPPKSTGHVTAWRVS